MDSRIQHVRLYMNSYNIGILNLYQFPYNMADPACGPLRLQFWNQLTALLVLGMPFAGCLNMSRQWISSVIGGATMLAKHLLHLRGRSLTSMAGVRCSWISHRPLITCPGLDFNRLLHC